MSKPIANCCHINWAIGDARESVCLLQRLSLECLCVSVLHAKMKRASFRCRTIDSEEPRLGCVDRRSKHDGANDLRSDAGGRRRRGGARTTAAGACALRGADGAGGGHASLHVYIRSGLKSHGEGAHDYPQFSADWSKLLTDKGALVDGSFHFPSAQELANTDVMVMFKGDAGYMTASERQVMEDYLKRGGGLVSIHDTLCGDDPQHYSTIVGGSKLHGERNFSSGAIKYTIVDKASPIMKGMSDSK